MVGAWQPAPEGFVGTRDRQIVEMSALQRFERNSRPFN